ncbi:DUF1080 domain-containing protein [Rhodocytophaga aerolata]|uniref:DUF1080 domain-containing protein n=1 Tax=Rhodocytophaga aerolata TaxID=455078 RepID=A0ABT8R4Z7_9BACT|nr:DUF1080 domain-containing protein [Rhodocytophaga aerolata]MDO1445720.1 DUF1080 domain-containing protein [Rhodocytophaga aerolata]
MKNLCLCIICFIVALGTQAQVANTLSGQEKKEGWKLLFDGKSLIGWHTYGKKGIGPAWKVEGDALLLHVPERAGNKTQGGGDIVTDDVFTGDFELKFDWKITRLANSGVFLFVTESPKYENAHNTGLEIQVTDNAIFGEGPDNNRRAGDLFGIASSRLREVKSVGEWNQTHVVFQKGRLNIFLNGFQIHEIRLDSQAWKEALAKSGLKEAPISQGKFTGRIGIQDWGSQAWYRNIKIKPL